MPVWLVKVVWSKHSTAQHNSTIWTTLALLKVCTGIKLVLHQHKELNFIHPHKRFEGTACGGTKMDLTLTFSIIDFVIPTVARTKHTYGSNFENQRPFVNSSLSSCTFHISHLQKISMRLFVKECNNALCD